MSRLLRLLLTGATLASFHGLCAYLFASDAESWGRRIAWGLAAQCLVLSVGLFSLRTRGRLPSLVVAGAAVLVSVVSLALPHGYWTVPAIGAASAGASLGLLHPLAGTGRDVGDRKTRLWMGLSLIGLGILLISAWILPSKIAGGVGWIVGTFALIATVAQLVLPPRQLR